MSPCPTLNCSAILLSYADMDYRDYCITTCNNQSYFIMLQLGLSMFEPKEESLILEIVGSFFDIKSDEMVKVGDLTKESLFGPGVDSQEAAVEQLKAVLKDMPKEHALIAGIFVSGLLRCNLAQQAQQCMQETAEESRELD